MTAFTFGGVFSRFFKIIGENAVLLLGIGLVVYVLPSALINYGIFSLAGVTQATWPQKIMSMTPQYWGWLGGAGILLTAFNLFSLAAVTEVTILRSVGKPVAPGPVIAHALGNIIPILIISLMVTFLTIVCSFALFVPGIMFMLASYVAIPARVGEPGLGLWGSVQRSFDLTRNHRWLILLLLIVFGLLFAAVVQAFSLTLTQFMPFGSPSAVMAQGAISGIQNLFSSVLVVAIYVSLRESKDKATPDQTANVFA